MSNVTIKDIAEYVGCSVMTVSNVLNKKKNVRAKTVESVNEAVVKLGYKPNQAARRLVEKRKSDGVGGSVVLRRFGCIIPDDLSKYGDPYYGEILESIEQELLRHGFKLVYTEKQSRVLDSFDRTAVLDDTNIDGLIILDCSPQTLNICREFTNNIVRVGAPVSGIEIDYVTCNMVQAGQEAVEYLQGLGHKRIAFVGPELAPEFVRNEREGGYRMGMLTAQPPLSVDAYYTSVGLPETAFKDALAMLEGKNRPTAVFCHNDMIASMVLKAAWSLGISVPEELSVVGFNDDAIARLCCPALTSMRVNKSDLGRIIAQTAVSRHENTDMPYKTILVPCVLVERESCAEALGDN